MIEGYFSLMVRAELLERLPNGIRASFQVSEKGKKSLQLYHKLETLLETDERREC